MSKSSGVTENVEILWPWICRINSSNCFSQRRYFVNGIDNDNSKINQLRKENIFFVFTNGRYDE